jgi:hypothetical protein
MTLKEFCNSKNSCLECESKRIDEVGIWCCMLKKYVEEDYCER